MKTLLKQELDFKVKMKKLKEVVKGTVFVYQKTLEDLLEKEKREVSKYEVLLGTVKLGRVHWEVMDEILTYMGVTSEGFCDKLYSWLEEDNPLVSMEVNGYLVEFSNYD